MCETTVHASVATKKLWVGIMADIRLGLLRGTAKTGKTGDISAVVTPLEV